MLNLIQHRILLFLDFNFQIQFRIQFQLPSCFFSFALPKCAFLSLAVVGCRPSVARQRFSYCLIFYTHEKYAGFLVNVQIPKVLSRFSWF